MCRLVTRSFITYIAPIILMPQKKVQDIIVPVKKTRKSATEATPRTVIESVRRPASVADVPHDEEDVAIPRMPPIQRPTLRPAPPVTRPVVRPAGSPVYAATLTRPVRSGGRARWMIWGIAGATLIGLFVAISTMFEHATLTITPRQSVADLDFFFTAEKNADPSKIPFEAMTLAQTDSVTVPATANEKVERRATGTIVIYNNFDASTQRLIKNTRFESADGLIYRISASVDVPGKKTVNGQATPGSVEAVVTADESGDRYNAESAEFTIPGFKNTPRFAGFYAKTKTPLSGGFSGMMPVVPHDELTKAQEILKNTISTRLMDDAKAQKPAGFTLFSDAVFLVYGEPIVAEAEKGAQTAKITQTATLYGMIFNTEVLSNYLARKVIPQFNEADRVLIENVDTLDFRIVSKQTVTPASVISFSFSLKGAPLFVWQFNEAELKSAVAGLARKELRDILFERFPGITKADGTIRPFWKQTFPKDVEDITIKTMLQNLAQ